MENKVALVTGSSRGVGKAIALSLAKEGYHLVINYQGNEAKASEVCEECKSYGVNAITIKCDVSKDDDVQKMIQEALQMFGRIDVLVNNSGITRDQLLLRMSEEDFNSVIDVNLKGCFHCIKHVSKIMMKQRSGVIINMASVIGQVGNVGQANYAASKAGIIGLTKSVAKELALRNIRCNAIAPGFIQSEMSDVLSEEIKTSIMQTIPMKKFGTTQDVASMVCFLVSDSSKYVTGQVLNVDGGMVM